MVKYFLNMLPYMALVTPIYLVARVLFVKKRGIKANPCRELLMFVFVLFVAGVASQMVIRKLIISEEGISVIQNGIHKTNLIPFKVFYETYIEVFEKGNVYYFLINFLGNIVIFMPFGLFIPALWGVNAKKTVAIGFLASLFIELCQMFLARGTDVDDLMLNTVGALLGVIIYKACLKRIKNN